MSAIAAGAIVDGPGDGAAGPDVWDSRDAGNDTGVISSAEETDEYYATLAETGSASRPATSSPVSQLLQQEAAFSAFDSA
jgi:hypothetical protein